MSDPIILEDKEVTEIDLMLAQQFVAALKLHAPSREKRMTAKQICDKWNAAKGTSFNDTHVRHWRNIAHNILFEPVCVTNAYWYSWEPDDIQATVDAMRSRTMNMLHSLSNQEKILDAAKKRRENLFQHPVVQALQKDFGAEVVK